MTATPARGLAVPLLVMLLAISGCAADAATEPTEAPTAPAIETPAAAETLPEEPAMSAEAPVADADADAAPETSDWLDYATDDGSVSFRYPADWALAVSASPVDLVDRERSLDSATLTAPNGQQLLAFYDFVDIGGACGSEHYVRPLEVLAREAVDVPTLGEEGRSVLATIALGTVDERWTVGVGITQEAYIDAPETCVVYFVAASSDGGLGFGTHFQLGTHGEDALWTVDSLDDARAYMETDEYRTIVEVLRSFEAR